MNLPHIIFLYGPRGVGKTSLANLITDCYPAPVFALSLRAPLHGGCAGTFFDCDPGMDLELQANQTTLNDDTAGKFMEAYHSFLIGRYGASALGQMAQRSIECGEDFIPTFVFDDCSPIYAEDMKYLVEKNGAADCLLVNMRGPGHAWTEPPDLSIPILEFENNALNLQVMYKAFISKFKEPSNGTLRSTV